MNTDGDNNFTLTKAQLNDISASSSAVYFDGGNEINLTCNYCSDISSLLIPRKYLSNIPINNTYNMKM